MSLHTVGSDTHYILPASFDSIPEAFRSCKAAKPIPCSIQTVNVPSLSGTQAAAGSSVIQIPCGASAGIMMNPYLRFTVQFTGTGTNAYTWSFKGAAQAATACINRISTYANSVQIDNQQNACALYDTLLTHSTSNDWLSHDATLMLGAGVVFNGPTDAANVNSPLLTFCVPLLGLLGSQQAMPLYLINGTLQVQIDWQTSVGLMYWDTSAPGSTDPAWTSAAFSNVQLVYDKVMPEEAFVQKVRHDMMAGAKYVYSYTNFASVTLPLAGAGTANLNYGINVSSLRGVVSAQYVTANLSTVSNQSGSLSNNINQYQVSLDGRLISSLALDSTLAPALFFAELQKSFGRIFDASITDPIVATSASVVSANISANYFGGPYLTTQFAAGASAQRINEGLAFQGSPCSIANIQVNLAGTTGGVATVASTLYFIFIADFQLLVDSTGSVEIVR